jgi:hypothetical protein
MHIAPALNKSSFSCPHCHAIAAQQWFQTYAKISSSVVTPTTILGSIDVATAHLELVRFGVQEKNPSNMASLPLTGAKISRCFSCKNFALWAGNRVVWPATNVEIIPNPDMPAAIKADFLEAASIVQLSPRGAAALLRLALQKLINSLVGRPIEIDKGIQELVNAGLPQTVQQACDYVRIVGNEAVHPGAIDIRDDIAMATNLFNLLNLIVTHTISFQNTMASIYPQLPPSKLKGVEDRMKGAAKKLTSEPGGSGSPTAPVIEDGTQGT